MASPKLKNLSNVRPLNKHEVAELLGVHVRSVDRYVATNPHFPKPIVLSPRCRVWRRADVLKFLGLPPDALNEPSGAEAAAG